MRANGWPTAQRLRALVLVVGEDEVEPPAVDPELRPELLRGHRGALDVPARATDAPWRLPGRVLALLRRLPEREVAWILLGRVRLLLLDLVGPLPRERAVRPEPLDPEVDVPVDRVGVARREQLPIIAMISGIVSVASGCESGMPEAERRSVLEVPARRLDRARSALSPGAAS